MNLVPEVTVYQLIIVVISAVTSLILGCGLLKNRANVNSHRSLGLFLIMVAIANGFRGLSWLNSNPEIVRISFMAFILSPLLLAIFLEKALLQRLNSFLKILLLGTCCILLHVLLRESGRLQGVWNIVYIVYLQCSTGLLVFTSLKGIRSSKCQNEKSVYMTILVTGVAAIIFVGIDLISFYFKGINLRLSSVAFLILNFFMASVLFSHGNYLFRRYIFILCKMTAIGLLTSVVINIVFEKNIWSDSFIEITLLVIVCQIPFYVLDKIFGISASISGGNVLARINSIDSSSEESLLKDLSDWDEIQKVYLLTKEYLKNEKLEFIFKDTKLKDYENRVLTKKDLDTLMLKEKCDFLEGLKYIMLTTDCDYLIVLPKYHKVLVVSFTVMMNGQYFRDLVLFIKGRIEDIKEPHQEVIYD